MKLPALVLALSLSVTACTSRNANLQVRYTGIVLVVAGAITIIEPRFNGDGFDTKLLTVGSILGGVGAALLIGSLVALPGVRRLEAVDEARAHQREVNLKAVELLHRAEAATAAGDCATVVQLTPQIDALDAGVGGVLRANVAAARCLKPAPESPAPDPQ